MLLSIMIWSHGKQENWSKIMSGKLWHSTLKWSCTRVESLTSCTIVLQNLPQGPTCCWLHPQIPDFPKQGKELQSARWKRGVDCQDWKHPFSCFGPTPHLPPILYTEKPETQRREFAKVTQWKKWAKRTGRANHRTPRPRCSLTP